MRKTSYKVRQMGNCSSGWATMEILLLMPVIALTVVMIFFIGDYFSKKLELINAVGSAAIKAGLKFPPDCDRAVSEIKSLFPGARVSCNLSDEFVTLSADYDYKSRITYVDIMQGFTKSIKVSSTAARVQKSMD